MGATNRQHGYLPSQVLLISSISGGLPHWQAWCGRHQLVAGGEGHGGPRVQDAGVVSMDPPEGFCATSLLMGAPFGVVSSTDNRAPVLAQSLCHSRSPTNPPVEKMVIMCDSQLGGHWGK